MQKILFDRIDPTANIAIRNIEKECKNMEYFRGDIVYVSKGKYVGSEQGGDRPAVIVSNNTGNHFSDCVEIVYLTSAAKKDMPTHVDVICKCMSTALCEQIYTISKERITEFIRTCTKAEMQKIDEALMISLALNKETPSDIKNETEADIEAKNRIAELEKQIEEQKIVIDDMTKMAEAVAKTDNSIDTEKVAELFTGLTKVTAERDVYKSLYDDLLKKVTG